MNRRNYLQTLSALFAVSAFGGCTSVGKQKGASNSETDIAGPALAGGIRRSGRIGRKQKFLSGQRLGTERLL